MRTTPEAVGLIKFFENCRLEAYQDQAGIWTCGYGRTGGVVRGLTISQQEADAWLMLDLEAVEHVLNSYVTCKLNDNQFSALVSFCYNVGFGRRGVKDGFRYLKSGGPSTLWKLVQVMDFPAAADEFPKWCKVRGVPCNGLVKRRLAEMDLFLKT